MYRKAVCGVFFLFLYALTFGQEIKVNGYFIEDSIKIGQGSPYVLTAKYPRNLDIIFPDSLYDYNPYELGEKRFFPTQSTAESSYDSAVYFLLSFEIDSVQYFQLPIYQLTGADSIEIKNSTDSIYLKHAVAEIPDSVAVEAMPLIENTTYRYVNLALNYPYLIAGIIILIILTITIYFVFGKSIRKWFKLRRMDKRHKTYLQDFNALKFDSKEEIERLILLWKSYHEKLEDFPFTKMTTKELLKLEFTQKVENELKTLDRAIYGNQQSDINPIVNELLRFSENRYADKVNEIKHG